jgi:hypothetical protein
MTLSINRSTVGHDAPLAPLTIDQDDQQAGASQDSTAPQTAAAAGEDTASISSQGQRLAALQTNDTEMRAIAACEDLVRQLTAKMQASPQQAAAAQSALDSSRVASLLEG